MHWAAKKKCNCRALRLSYSLSRARWPIVHHLTKIFPNAEKHTFTGKMMKYVMTWLFICLFCAAYFLCSWVKKARTRASISGHISLKSNVLNWFLLFVLKDNLVKVVLDTNSKQFEFAFSPLGRIKAVNVNLSTSITRCWSLSSLFSF